MHANPTPRLTTLYYNDFPFKRAVNAFVAGLLVAVGVFWVSQTPSNAPAGFVSPEQMAAPYIVIAAGVIASGAALYALYRYRLIHALLSDGVSVQGCVEAADRYTTQVGYTDQFASRARYRYTYAVRVLYQVHGLDYRKHFKLPLSPSHFGLKPEHITELRVRPEQPSVALLMVLYRD